MKVKNIKLQEKNIQENHSDFGGMQIFYKKDIDILTGLFIKEKVKVDFKKYAQEPSGSLSPCGVGASWSLPGSPWEDRSESFLVSRKEPWPTERLLQSPRPSDYRIIFPCAS